MARNRPRVAARIVATGPARDAHDRYVALAKGDDLEAMLAHIGEHMQQGLDTVIAFVGTRQP